MTSQAVYRAAAVTLLADCATNANVELQTYRARPRTLYPPTAFVDSMEDELTEFPGASNIYQHKPVMNLVCVWGIFDSGEAVDQRDAFVDAFHDWVRARPHAAGGEALIGPRRLRDDPNWQPDWGPVEQQEKTYYATLIELEGFGTD